MPRITFLQPDGTRRTIEAESGRTLMQVEVAAGIAGIDALCGGSCMCATCQVHIDPIQAEALPLMAPMEAELLAAASGGDIAKDTRLSCQIIVTDAMEGLFVRVASSQG